MSFYSWIICGTILFPFVLSFDRKVQFYKQWKSILVAIFSVGLIFILWDMYFTSKDVWGFNARYITGIFGGNLPIEEWLFFAVAPYACLFIHEVLKAYFPRIKLELFGKAFAFTMVLSGLVLAITHLKQWYTMTACSFAAVMIIGFAFQRKMAWFGSFAFTFVVALIPFMIVNGMLTGSVTPEPVVWYNEEHIVGIRLMTIPIEDIYYNCCLLLPIVAIHEYMQKKTASKNETV